MPEPSRSTAGEAIDRPEAAGPEPGHLVITVHGIRTYGNWQGDLRNLLKQAEPGITVLNYQYGYFSSLAFLIPPLRWLVAYRFRKFFEQAVSDMPAGSRIDLVAHSFGTYLAAAALPYIPPGRQLHTVIFAGSVLRPSFPWYKYHQTARIGHLVNECGWDDSILVLCQGTALMMGMAGRVGFQGMVGEHFMNRYYRFGHGGYFERPDFMRLNWVPLLTSDAEAMRIDERPPLTSLAGAQLFLLNNFQFIKMAGAVAITLAIVLIPLDWMRKADFKKRVERFARIARLANAEHIPGSDPDHVRELLRVDTALEDGQSIDHIIGADSRAGDDDLLESDSDEDDTEPKWYEAIPGFRDMTRISYHARRQHARANHQLATGKSGKSTDLAKARVLYEDAIKSYRQVNGQDPAHGSYALCLTDYGRLLLQLGLYDSAIPIFKRVRKDAFPENDPRIPRSLIVDAICYESDALKGLERWDEAATALNQAVTECDKDPALLSFVYNKLAWLNMDRLEVSKARENFILARDACLALLHNDQFVYKARLYHIRHGLAMTQRLLGNPEESYNQYDQIVTELQEVMRKDLTFNPKERGDLRDRLVNSMERRADVKFFARRPPAFFSGKDSDAEKYRDAFEKVEDDYREAIKTTANDDLTIKVRLLQKKVIAHYLGELTGRPATGTVPTSPALAPARGWNGVEPIDVEFAESEMTYDALSPELRSSLTLYRQLAACCMSLHKAPALRPRAANGGETPTVSRYAPKAVTDLRNLTVEYAARCEKLSRENVEMLLIALEVLLEPGIEDNQDRSAEDASRMMAVLGATTKVPQHDELKPYVNRFNRIAAGRLGGHDLPGEQRIVPVSKVVGVGQEPEETRSIDERTLFFLRLSPTRSLRITEDNRARLPRPVAEPVLDRGPAGGASLSARP